MLADPALRFPEGLATAEVLIVANRKDAGFGVIAPAALAGGTFKLGSSGLRLWHESLSWSGHLGPSLLSVGSSLSPALASVGFIVGLNVAVLVFAGGAINWLVVIPLLSWWHEIPVTGDLAARAMSLWAEQTRYIGVGAMVVGGLWTLFQLRTSMAAAVRSSIHALRRKGRKPDVAQSIPRTERELSFAWSAAVILLLSLPLGQLVHRLLDHPMVSLAMVLFALVAGQLFTAVGSYMAGLVGSGNNPISGLAVATVLSGSLLALILGRGDQVGPAAAIYVGAFVSCAAAMASDNMQDLKAGQVLGATPIKQQLMQIVGVFSAAAVIGPVLDLLNRAYGIGAPSAAHPQALSAPQASLIATVASGVFSGTLPASMIAGGVCLGLLLIGLDLWLAARRASFRAPVLAVAVGIYLPLTLSIPILVGGLIHAGASRRDPPAVCRRHGLLFAAGLITGEALVGILMAIPIVLSADKMVLALFDRPPLAGFGPLAFVAILAVLFRVTGGTRHKEQER
jgi:putative OPT family oligopeptide transporter